uniref:Uncharacterized protein n=1 Tax=Candidatus Kentrum sp. LPFa TaxID=2126335 RepID=A0A450XHW0_9GAMM|nr:MAG: hypothetical protein BECKLPF1236A_GA0070988_100764 [Candidatus Kentron sp. LPFa]VFK28910.1 MAG: hypothetical protein BECKLPF1236C_GA0070990_100764 [Candidatus Kentron sp. LPFa]
MRIRVRGRGTGVAGRGWGLNGYVAKSIVAIKFSTSDELYRKLVEESEKHWLLGLVTFASIEEQRIEWTGHYEDNNGKPPTLDEIRNWYEQQTEKTLLCVGKDAEDRLREYSKEVLGSIIEEHKKETEEGVIIGEIKKSRHFWPQFWVNLAGGTASAILFAMLLAVIAFIVLNDTSPAQLVEHLTGRTEVVDNEQ